MPTTARRPQKPSPVDVLAQRAQQATDLRYGPEVQALRQLGLDARSSYLAGAGQARSAANSTVAATNESSGGLAEFLARAGSRGQETLNRIGPVSGALSNEGQLAARNHGLDVQSVAASLANAKLRAQQAGTYQTQRLYSQYRGDTAKINSQASDLAGQAGQYAQQVYQSLLDDKLKSDAQARKVAADARNAALNRGTQRLLAGVDVNGQVIPGSPTDVKAQAAAAKETAAADKATKAEQDKVDAAAKKEKDRETAAKKASWLTPQQQNSYISAVKTIAGLVRDQVGKPIATDVTLPNGTVLRKGQVLTSGAARQLLVTKSNPLGRAFDPTQINAAFDLAQLGSLSPANVKALHSARVKVHGFLPSGSRKTGKPIASAGKPKAF